MSEVYLYTSTSLPSLLGSLSPPFEGEEMYAF